MTPDAPAPIDGATPPAPPKRSPGHRGTDIRDTVAEMTARANEIQIEAGNKMANALRNIVRAAIGNDDLSPESTRDVVDYFRRRALMSSEDAQALLAEVLDYASRRKPTDPPKAAGIKPNAAKVESLAPLAERLAISAEPTPKPVSPAATISAPAPAAVAVKPAEKVPSITTAKPLPGAPPEKAAKATKPAAKAAAPAKAAEAKPAAKAPAAKPEPKAAAKAEPKAAAKPEPKAAAKAPAKAEVKAAPAAKPAAKTAAKAPVAKAAAKAPATKAAAKAPAKKK